MKQPGYPRLFFQKHEGRQQKPQQKKQQKNGPRAPDSPQKHTDTCARQTTLCVLSPFPSQKPLAIFP